MAYKSLSKHPGDKPKLEQQNRRDSSERERDREKEKRTTLVPLENFD